MGWESVKWGVGHRAELDKGVAGFHTAGGSSVFSGIVWRGASRGPDQIFKSGFTVNTSGEFLHGRKTSATPQYNLEEGTTRGVVSTALWFLGAAIWAANKIGDEGWMYCMWLDKVQAAMGTYQPGLSQGAWFFSELQREVLVSGGIEGKWIVAGRKVKRLGEQQMCYLGECVLNPDFVNPKIPGGGDLVEKWRLEQFVTADHGDDVTFTLGLVQSILQKDPRFKALPEHAVRQ